MISSQRRIELAENCAVSFVCNNADAAGIGDDLVTPVGDSLAEVCVNEVMYPVPRGKLANAPRCSGFSCDTADLHGRIAEVLAMAERVAAPAVPKGRQQKAPGTGVRGGVSVSQLSLVAGTRNRRRHYTTVVI